jgi:NitT/TauT family transport system permease protein
LQFIYEKIPKQLRENLVPNRWDIIALLIFITLICLLGSGAEQMSSPYALGDQLTISLDPSQLPHYGLRTVLRMLIALFFSLLFSILFGMTAARNARAERIIIPMIDILQSVPVLGFLSITVVGFISLFPNSLLGPECAAIFAIFTAQAWNMALSVYQSFRTVPSDLIEVSKILQLNSWQRFWRVEMPFATPGLLWNTMMSMSASWFFVVAAEAITVSKQNILLPGIGSYIATAIAQGHLAAVGYAAIAMFFIILIYDQLIFRPLIKWSEKFYTRSADDETPSTSWLYTVLKRTKLLRFLSFKLGLLSDWLIASKRKKTKAKAPTKKLSPIAPQWTGKSLDLLLILAILSTVYATGHFIFSNISLEEVVHVFLLGGITALRIMCLLILASIIWIPVGVWVGLRPNVARWVQPIAQFLAAFPANLLFPFVVWFIVRYSLNVEIWTTPLMILGTQWCILFNVIAGASAIPKDIQYAAKNLNVRGILWWKRVSLPAIFPFFVTGALAAAGGCWNASIVAEVVTWGDTTLTATGLGAYISEYTTNGDFPRIVLGISVMCFIVVVLNRTLWHRLYTYAESRCRLDI